MDRVITNEFSIKDIERFTGIKAHTLRIWEQRYHLLKPERTSTNIRYYTIDDLRLLLNVAVLIKQGMRISQIARLSSEERSSKVNHFEHQGGDTTAILDRLKLAAINLQSIEFDRVINHSIEELGFEKAFETIIFPFIRLLGILWQTKSITAVQEHFASNLIRQKLYGAIDKLDIAVGPEARSVVLYLPELELHELSLLYAHYRFKKAGYLSVYLGQSVPLEDLLLAYENIKPSLFFSVFTSYPAGSHVQDYIDRLQQMFKGIHVPFYITGLQMIEQESKRLPGNICVLHSLSDFDKMLQSRG